MPKRSDARTLKNLIDQAYLIASSDPMPKGGIESLRENLDAARALVRVLLLKPSAESIAAELGKRGGNTTAKRMAEEDPEFYSRIAGLRKERKGGRPKKHEDVIAAGVSPSSVRSRAAFLIVKRMKELGMDTPALANAIHASEQYVRNLIQGVTIPSDEKITALIKGLDLDDVRADQLRTVTTQDRLRHDGRFRAV